MAEHGRFRRYEMNGFLRGLLLFVLILMLAAIALAAYASQYDVVLMINRKVLDYSQDSQAVYQVITRTNDFSGQLPSGMDEVYMRAYTEAVEASFSVRFTADRPLQAVYRQALRAEIRICDSADPQKILLSRPILINPEQTGQIDGQSLEIQETVRLDLDEYSRLADTFQAPAGNGISRYLAVYLDVQVEAALPVDPLLLSIRPSILIPLDQARFSISRAGNAAVALPVRQNIRYKLSLTPLPLYVYGIAALVCLGLLVVILTTTRRQRKNRFEKQLRRMMRQARSRMLLIRDKAWEPEWCISVADFRTMARTARKLKHPLFCYIDRHSDPKTAYFYSYYGENNFCHIFSDSPGGQPDPYAGKFSESAVPAPVIASAAAPAAKPVNSARSAAAAPSEKVKPPAIEAARIPLLPETDNKSDILF
jgi:hypothetical protein